MTDLFEDAAATHQSQTAPLPQRIRPRSLDELVGQRHVLAEGSALRLAIEGDPGVLGLGAWAAVHGLAMLLVDGPLRDLVPRDDTLTPLIDGVLDTILLGLEARPRLTP